MNKVLVTCPPMLGMLNYFHEYANIKNIELIPAKVTQTLTEQELIELLPNYDGWIIGDDPASRKVFESGKNGKLKAAVKWGIGVDNVDFNACKEFNIPIINTPFMFGSEVADVALAYVIGLARHLHYIHLENRINKLWVKPSGISLSAKNIAVIGLGDIGRQLVKRLLACEMNVTAYDPFVATLEIPKINREIWPNNIDKMDFIVFTCSLNKDNRHMLNSKVLDLCKNGVKIINVARGPLIDEKALIEALKSNKVNSVALDVFEEEPLNDNSYLRDNPYNILGSHNGSNTKDAVIRASNSAIDNISIFLNSSK